MQAIANKSALFAACEKFATSRVTFIAEVIAAGYPTSEAAQPVIMEWVSTKTGCPLKTQGTRRVVFDSASPKAGSARRALADMMLNLAGTTRREAAVASPVVSKKATPLTKAQKAAIAALLAAFGGDKKAAKAAF
jgi:hypothetical protein